MRSQGQLMSVGCCALALLTGGCRNDPGEQAAADQKAPPPGTFLKTKGAKNQGRDCPKGTYDYVNLAEFVDANVSGVVQTRSETGKISCGFPTTKNQFRCSTRGVEYIGVTQGEGAAKVTIHIEGGTTVHFTELGAGRWKTNGTDNGEFEMTAHMEIDGQQVDFPIDDMYEAFSKRGAVIEYSCKGDMLEMTTAGLQEPWILKRR